MTSALYPLTIAVDGGKLAAAQTVASLFEVPDGMSKLMSAGVGVLLVTVLTPTYLDVNSASKLTAASIPNIDLRAVLITTGVTDVGGKLTNASVAVTLQQIVVSYTNVESSSKLTSAAVTGITLT